MVPKLVYATPAKIFDIDYMYTDSGEYKPCKDLFSE